MNCDDWWYSPLFLDRKEGSQEYFFVVVVFCTTVKGLQVRSTHGAVPQCAAHGAHESKHTHTQFVNPHIRAAINCFFSLSLAH